MLMVKMVDSNWVHNITSKCQAGELVTIKDLFISKEESIFQMNALNETELSPLYSKLWVLLNTVDNRVSAHLSGIYYILHRICIDYLYKEPLETLQILSARSL